MKIKFHLPPKVSLKPNDKHNDPLKYYYHPIVGYLYRKRIEQALSLLTPPYKSILEIGYGSGILLPTLNTLGQKLSGIDLISDPDETAHLLKCFNVFPNLTKADIAEQIYPKNSFDLVVAISVFEHILNPVPVLDRIYDILSDDGFLLVGMPRVDALMSRLFEIIGYPNINDHHVLRHVDFLKYSENKFKLVRFKTIPMRFPSWTGLYFNMLLKKNS